MLTNLKIYDNMLATDERRFYPSFIPIVPYEPLKTNFIIPESPEEIKKGVISLVTFEPEDLVAQLVGFAINFQTLHTLEHAPGIYYSDEFFGGYLIHSCEPNCMLRMSDFTLHALKKITPFSLLTIDYEQTESRLYQSFTCKCGSEKCRSFIEGKIKQ